MASNIRRFISARSGREFALNIDHVVLIMPGDLPDVTELDMVGKARQVRGSYTEVLLHVENGTAETKPPGGEAAERGQRQRDDDAPDASSAEDA